MQTFKSLIKGYTRFAGFLNRFLWNDKAFRGRSIGIKYGFAIFIVALATVLKLYVIPAAGEDRPFLLYIGAVLLAAGFGGAGPGIIAILLSVFTAVYFFTAPYDAFFFNTKIITQMIVFSVEAVFAILLSGSVTRVSNHLRRRAQRFHALTENSADAVAVINSENKILYASASSEKVLGFSQAELKELDLGSRTDPEESERLDEFFQNVIQNPGKPFTLIHKFQHKSGRWIWVESTVTNMFHHPDIKAIVSNFRNVSDRVELEKHKEDFVGIATHELKTPVTSIKAYAQFLLSRFKKKGDENSVMLVEKMDAQLNKLIGLIQDLLDVTRVESGKLELHEDYYNFNQLVLEVAEELQRTTSTHIIRLKLSESEKIYGDRERIGQVLTNLISNAIKYSPGKDEIIVYSQKSDREIKLCVEDHGIGIDEKYTNKIFERFYRASGPYTNTFPGLGLGLYISSEIIKRQHGRIWVQSKKGTGSTFCFSIPLDYRLQKPSA